MCLSCVFVCDLRRTGDVQWQTVGGSDRRDPNIQWLINGVFTTFFIRFVIEDFIVYFHLQNYF